MERLLLAFVFIGTALACSPVPEPKVKGKGNDTVYVFIVTNQSYNPAGVSTFLSDFSKTEIQQYSASLGDFSDLNCTDQLTYFTWTFKLTNANCSIVGAWLVQIQESSSFYQLATCYCNWNPYTAENLVEITTPLPSSTTTATPFVIVPGGALPVAPVVIPYQLDYEETAEHVEESVSSFEDMSIMNL